VPRSLVGHNLLPLRVPGQELRRILISHDRSPPGVPPPLGALPVSGHHVFTRTNVT
jgi:hypothetical protein